MPASMFTPRPYQIELVERALKRNTIACLNSTAAKSFVWKTYLREILGNNFRVTREDGKETNAFVLFNSDHLVREYGVTLNTHLDMSVLSLPTEKGLQLNQEEWENILLDKKIIVTTPKVLASALTKSLFERSLASVLVFDECEAVLQEESDYTKIVQIFKESDCRPYILGLTCSLLKEDSSAAELENAIKSMEELLGCKAETATDLIALDGCSPSQPDEKIVLCGSKKITFEDGEGAKVFDASKLSAEIHEILAPAIEWLKICQVTSDTGIVATSIIFESEEAQNASEEETSSNEDSDTEEDTSVVKNCDNEAAIPLSSDDKPLSATTSGQREVDINALVATYLTVLSQVLLVLDVLGLWCAHRLIILLLKQLQKNIRVQDSLTKCTDDRSKWKYLLLRYADSHLRTVYTLCQTHLGHQKKIDLLLVTPKVDRLLQVLKEYRPPAEPDKKNESSKVSRYNDRSEANYVSWWQDSDAEEDDEEEQMINRGNERNDNNWNEKDEEANSGTTRTRQYHHANTLCGIVFVKEKYVAVMLQRLLKEVSKEDSDLWHISSAHITSLASTETSSSILEKANVTQDMYNNTTNTERLKQEEVLRSFRSHEINLLVSTNCMEEYAEIPKCNLVLRFDVPTTYKSYILSKSRVRSTNSTYMMLVHEGEKPDFLLRLQEYKKIEKVLQDSTYEIQAKKTAPADFDYFDVKEDDSDDEFELARAPPYYSGPNTCVTLDSAIHIINRYCSRLPSDPFTHLSPRCEVMEVSNSEEDISDPLFSTATSDKAYQGILQLPINAHVCNPIKGVSMSTVLLAQKAVALEACKVLHNAGELDDHFMPIGKEMVKYAEELDSWPDEKSQVPGRPGTTKRRQTYEKQIPAALSDCLPSPDAPLFLYEIEMKLKTRLPDGLNVRRRRLHAPEETTRCFGILTANPLPPILGFPIFTRSGEESVRIRLCRSFISLGEHHIKMIRSFHHYIFSDMLRIDRVPLTFRPDSSQMQIFVVILDKPSPASDLDIDWRFMCEVSSKRRIDDRMRSDPWFRHRVLESKGGKKVFVFNRSKYEDGVVIAKYRSPDQPNRFYVAEIKDELDPYSSFPSSEYESFHHYYRIKYGLNICCLNQPLLDVDHTSSRLNLLTPRYMNQKGKVLPVSSLEKKRAKYETLTNRQILVPELCDLHPIPASLWRKAVCIPSIIYRLSSILLAEELRRKIFEESGIGQETLPLGHDWPDLNFGWENDQSDEEESRDDRTTCNAAGDAKCGCGKISNENLLQKSEPAEMTNLEVNASGDAPSKRVDLSSADSPQKAEIEEAGGMTDVEWNAAGDATGKSKVLSNVDTPQKRESGEVTNEEGNAAGDAMTKSIEISKVNPLQKSETGESEEMTDSEGNATGVATSESDGISKVDLSEKSETEKSNEVANMESSAGNERGESIEGSKGDPCQKSESGEMVDEERNSSGSTTTESEGISSIDPSREFKTPPTCPEQTSGSDSSKNTNSDVSNITNGELSSVKNGNHPDSNGISGENEPKSVTTNSSDSELDFDYESDEFQQHFHILGDETTNRKRKIKKPRAFGSKRFTLGVIPRELIQKISTPDDSTTKNKFTGPSPGLILQALTLSNASDGFNLERLEMLGDSFLKHAVTVYLFCTYPDAHEGKLSYMRSKKVSNYNLYRIGQQRKLPGKMTALIFDPAVNWLPPGYVIGTGNHACDDDDIYKDTTCDSLDDEMEIGVWTGVPGQKVSPPKPEKTPEKAPTPKPAAPTHSQDDRTRFGNADEEEEGEEIFDEDEIQMIDNMLGGCLIGGMNGFRGGSSHSSRSNGFSSFTGRFVDRNVIIPEEGQNQRDPDEFVIDTWTPVDADGKPLCATDPLLIDLHTQQSLADKSVADCVEAILGAYLTTCGHRAAQLLLCYFGLKVLPRLPQEEQQTSLYGFLKLPTNVLLDESPSGYRKLELFTKDLTAFEKKINYTFKNKAYLLQAFTHASYYLNTITDCYQRLEFLGDAILDFLITCRLFNDPAQRHSPGALTDLRSALVNNTIFASLAVRHDFHKYFKAISPELHHIIGGFVRYQHLQEEAQGMDAQLAKRYYPTTEDSGIDDLEDIIVAPDAFIDQDDGEEEEEEDVEVPKALGDIFESVAGAIYMDSGMNLDEVWRVYEPMMGPLIEKFSSCVPRAPVRELLEMEPETAKFSWAEKRCDGKVRVTVEVIGKGSFKGIGRSYRIAKSAAARRALRFLKSQDDDCCN